MAPPYSKYGLLTLMALMAALQPELPASWQIFPFDGDSLLAGNCVRTASGPAFNISLVFSLSTCEAELKSRDKAVPSRCVCNKSKHAACCVCVSGPLAQEQAELERTFSSVGVRTLVGDSSAAVYDSWREMLKLVARATMYRGLANSVAAEH
ncbi:hypothetical protein T492DRAFT_846461 [Pavlovales sp. CCMP2436]|nr:hypothetical protein T492DRAFT_846461 [Pavlovales sp. CCMP2436]